MLPPKSVHSKIMQSLKHIKKQWDEDREENPHLVPSEITGQLNNAIRRHLSEARLGYNKDMLSEEIAYLVKKGIIVESPYGGHFFPLDAGVVLPSKEDLIRETIEKFKK